MQVIRHPTDIVEVREGEKQFDYNLHYPLHKEQLITQVGKDVMTLLTNNKGQLIDCKTLKIEE